MEWLLTWIWHGMALTLFVSGGLRLCPRVGASARHVIWWVTLAGVMALGWPGGPAVAADAAVASARVDAFALEIPATPAWLKFAALAAWGAVVAVGLARLAASLWCLGEQRRNCRPISTERERRLSFWMAGRDAARRARLMVSDTMPIASVLGLVRPLIVLPGRLLSEMTDRQLDLVVLHEQAHVRRWDDWTRLAQTAIETVFPFHPAVWWIGRSLALEREVACDERVVGRAGSPKTYAGCLTRVAELTMRPAAGALAPGIFGTGRALVRRVERLLAPPPFSGRAARRLSALAGVGLVAVAASQFHRLPPLFVEQQAGSVVSPERMVAMLSMSWRPVRDSGPAGEVPTVPVPARRVRASAGSLKTTRPSVKAMAASDPEPLQATAVPAPAANISPEPESPPPVGQVDEPAAAAAGAEPAVLDSRSPWRQTADAGIAVGASAQQSGLAIASAFSQLGRSLGRAF